MATLLFHVGVAVEMDYSPSGSSAYSVADGNHTSPSAENALRTHFKYKSDLRQVSIDDYSDAGWSALLMNELNNNRPILYSGRDTSGGHAFVCDGYNNAGLFHFNWGWGGWCDGYYTIGHLNPASGGAGGNSTYTFNLRNQAVIGIEPDTSFGNATTVTVTSANTAYGTVAGGGVFTGTNTSTVTLTATAASGCRFTGWNDGYRFNPRSFLANGGTYSFTANFEPLAGDTLAYCQNHCVTGYGANSGSSQWGICLPASLLTPGHDLTKVQLYIRTAGVYTLNIYTGTTSPTTTVCTQNFSVSTSTVNQWGTLTLSTPVSVDGTQSIWIAFSSSADHPAAASYYCGNDNSRLWGPSFSPIPHNYSFMIRGIFADNSPTILTGDTLSYCADSAYVNSAGASGSLTWGIRFMPATLAGHDTLTDVRLFVHEGGTYNLAVYQGTTTSTATQVASQTFNFPSSADSTWQNCHLATPVAINTSQPLWIVFSNTGTNYPAAMCAFTGDTNSSLVNLGNNWISLYTAAQGSFNGSWMIQAITRSGGSTAILGDTVDYCADNALYNTIGAGGSLTWGIRLPAAMHQHRQYLTKVMLYVPSAGTYNLNIYQGNATTTATNVAAQSATYTASQANMWQTINITTPITLNPSQPLWITFTNTGVDYPAALCNITADTNGSLVTLNNGTTWLSLNTASSGNLDGTWMIRAILSNSNAPGITINGPTTVGVDMPVTFTVDGPAAASYNWLLTGATPPSANGPTATATWSTPGTYTVTVLSTWDGNILRDTHTITVLPCAINTFPYTMGFEPTDNMACWNIIDNDNDGYSWTQSPFTDATHSGSGAFASASYINNIGPLTPDNWLVSPQIQLPAYHGYTLTWYDGAYDSSYYAEHYSLYVSTTGNDVDDFSSEPLFQTTLTTHNYTQRTVDLSDYAGQTIHIAFRHHNSTDVYWLLIDDLSIVQTAPQTHTLTALSANPEMGSTTGGGTYNHNTTATLTAIANDGYHFVQWHDGNTDNPRTVTVTADTTYTAHFAADEPATFTITVLPANPAMGTVTGGGTYPEGTTVTLTALPNDGYRFVQWQDADTTNPRTITVTADATYIAIFLPIQTQGIAGPATGCTIAALPGNTVGIAGAEGHRVDIYDVVGRHIAGTPRAAAQCSFAMPHAGVYLVAVDGHPAIRIVVMP